MATAPTKPGTIAFGNETYEGQFQRTLSAAYAGMADLGEAFTTAREIGKPDPDRWYNAWFRRAESVREVADAAAAAGDRESARGAFLRAAEYYRQSYFFLRRDLTDPSLQRAYRRRWRRSPRRSRCWTGMWTRSPCPIKQARSRATSSRPTTPAPPGRRCWPPCGYDSTAEEGLVYVTGALQRGYNAMVFEGPGQGAALYRTGCGCGRTSRSCSPRSWTWWPPGRTSGRTGWC